MEIFAPDPVDQMAARVRARWSAADRRRAHASWWCAETATVPRTPPAVLMGALAGEFDAYAAHRRAADCATALSETPCQQGPTPEMAAGRAVSGTAAVTTSAASRADHNHLWVALAVGVVAVLIILLLVGLALGPAWRTRNQRDAADGHDEDLADNDDAVAPIAVGSQVSGP
nr:hypothetical protein [Pandoravirus belohorizontensis]